MWILLRRLKPNQQIFVSEDPFFRDAAPDLSAPEARTKSNPLFCQHVLTLGGLQIYLAVNTPSFSKNHVTAESSNLLEMPGWTRAVSKTGSTGALKRWKSMSIFHRPQHFESFSSTVNTGRDISEALHGNPKVSIALFIAFCAMATITLLLLQEDKSSFIAVVTKI